MLVSGMCWLLALGYWFEDSALVQRGNPEQFWYAATNLRTATTRPTWISWNTGHIEAGVIYYEVQQYARCDIRYVEFAELNQWYQQQISNSGFVNTKELPDGLDEILLNNGELPHQIDKSLLDRIALWNVTGAYRRDASFYASEHHYYASRFKNWHIRHLRNAALEFLFLQSLSCLFIHSFRWVRSPVRFGLTATAVVCVFFVPVFLGYSAFTFTSVGPSGGVLYPQMLWQFDGIHFDTGYWIEKHIPQVLAPLGYDPGPFVSMSGRYHLSVLDVLLIGQLIGLAAAGAAHYFRNAPQVTQPV